MRQKCKAQYYGTYCDNSLSKATAGGSTYLLQTWLINGRGQTVISGMKNRENVYGFVKIIFKCIN